MNKKIINTISIIGVALLMLLSAVLIAVLYPKETRQLDLSLQTRTISVEQNVIDYESIFNEYDDAKLERDGSLTTFEGKQTIKLSDLEELDEVALSTLDDEELTLKYNYSYDYETDLVTLTVVQVETTGDGELIETIVDTIEGTAFVNEAGEIDAVLDLDGETILLSELQETGKLNNCGWFKRLWKKIVVAVAVVAAVVAVAAVVVATCGAGISACVAAGVGVVAGATSSTLASTCLTIAMVAAGVSLAATTMATIDFEGVNYKLQEYSKVAKQLIKGFYYLAIGDKEGRMLVSPIRIPTKALAAKAMKVGLSIYTPAYLDAEEIATIAGGGMKAIWDPAHQNGYFAHYHIAGRPKPSSHAFYGVPTIKGSYM